MACPPPRGNDTEGGFLREIFVVGAVAPSGTSAYRSFTKVVGSVYKAWSLMPPSYYYPGSIYFPSLSLLNKNLLLHCFVHSAGETFPIPLPPLIIGPYCSPKADTLPSSRTSLARPPSLPPAGLTGDSRDLLLTQ